MEEAFREGFFATLRVLMPYCLVAIGIMAVIAVLNAALDGIQQDTARSKARAKAEAKTEAKAKAEAEAKAVAEAVALAKVEAMGGTFVRAFRKGDRIIVATFTKEQDHVYRYKTSSGINVLYRAPNIQDVLQSVSGAFILQGYFKIDS